MINRFVNALEYGTVPRNGMYRCLVSDVLVDCKMQDARRGLESLKSLYLILELVVGTRLESNMYNNELKIQVLKVIDSDIKERFFFILLDW